jgi:hypothetical protein
MKISKVPAFMPRQEDLPVVDGQPNRRNPQHIFEETVPFTVRLVGNEDDLRKAVQVRHTAYARHVPVFAETLRSAEVSDNEEGVVVLLAESKLDGSPLGTMRIHTNDFRPLYLEQSVQLPDHLRNCRLAEATRLGVALGKEGRLVTTMLFKAFFQFCQHTEVEWMVVAGRSPVDRQYDRLMFEDVFPGMGYIPLLHANNMPHRVMSFNVETAQARWAQAGHSLYDFIFRTRHPDIHLGSLSLRSKRVPWHTKANAAKVNQAHV